MNKGAAMRPHITIRPIARSDLEALLSFERANRAFFEEWVPPRPHGYFDRKRLATIMAEQIADLHGGLYGLILDEDAGLVGRINVTLRTENAERVAEVGYRVGKAMRGRGVASAALAEAIEWAKGSGVSCMEAYTMRENPGSVRVLEKAGFTDVKGATQAASLKGAPITLQLFRKPLAT